jgi:hypothetical protein
MKKLITFLLASVFLLAADKVTLKTIDYKLDLVLKKLNAIQKELKIKNEEIKKLQKQIKLQQKQIQKQAEATKVELAVKSCNKIKVVNLKHTYYPSIIPYYMLTVTLKNEYPYTITYLKGDLIVQDLQKTQILDAFVSKKVTLKPGESVTFTFKHVLNSPLEKYLQSATKKNSIMSFRPVYVQFKNGKDLECD